MKGIIYNAFVDEMEKISSTIVRGAGKGGGRRVRREHAPEEGFDPRALFQPTEGSEAAKEFAESKRVRAAGREVKSLAHEMGMRGGKKTPSQRLQMREKAKGKEKKKK